MAQASGRGRTVGDYLVGRQIGSGSFSVVWHGRHWIHGTEVAIKEIAMSRLNKKLQDSLMHEIFILKRINHPNIICLHDIIQGECILCWSIAKGVIYMYIQRHGRVPEAIAKHFMQQLAAGLQILRDNNLIHRDLKPQNLLLSNNDSNSVLKIADFGFARKFGDSCLSALLYFSGCCKLPLMNLCNLEALQKPCVFTPLHGSRDNAASEADLWSVGAILFQLVTGKTPFTGNNQIELLQNIMKSTELQFPSDIKDLSADCKDLCQKLLRRNPVERLTFEEFFNHPFLSQRKIDQSLGNRTFLRSVDSVPLSESISARNTENISPEDYLPFFLDDDSSGPEGSPSFSKRKPSMKSTYGFSLDTQVDGKEAKSNALNNKDFTPRHSSHNLEFTSFKPDINKFSNEYLHEAPKSMNQMSMNLQSRAVDSLELIDQDYVLVSGPPLDVSSSSGSTSKPSHVPHKSPSPPESSGNLNTVSMPIIGTANSHIGSLEAPGSASGTSQGSTDIGDVLEQPSTHCMSRIKSLQQCASAISELVREKKSLGEGRLEVFVVLAVAALRSDDRMVMGRCRDC
ncbi:hypothetical protein GH714_009524 [Hevea brasiliensis]|uniref:Protein kinase domain-containing protein n=1 Tax=Hevea brasiliensis TaxID=3981 RepID=A0A6A6KJL2_HEVBR|nr:hypothetical protein GH714_009524 [Hevea brasiliensis]